MPQGAFFEQRRSSPTSLALVVALHGAGLAALLTWQGVITVEGRDPPIKIIDIPIEEPPPETPRPLPDPKPAQPQHRSVIDAPPPRVPLPAPGPTVHHIPLDPGPIELAPPGGIDLPGPPPGPRPAPTPEPVRTDAQLDPRFAGDLQPPYPAAEERAQREGSVRIEVTIGPDGRVKAVRRVSATTDAFWRATERQALSRWRFRPATLDGRPIESRKTLTVHFQLQG